MAREYALLLDESVYAEMVKDAYDAPPWMARQSVRSKATQLPRSKKKLDELCKKKAIREGDTFTMMKTSTSGAAIVFSATIEAFDRTWRPQMRTIGRGHGNLWLCPGPNRFDMEMVRTHGQGNLLRSSSHYTWDTIKVTRNNQELGSLCLLRQCFELWEDEMNKWGCNGLGEKLSDKL